MSIWLGIAKGIQKALLSPVLSCINAHSYNHSLTKYLLLAYYMLEYVGSKNDMVPAIAQFTF